MAPSALGRRAWLLVLGCLAASACQDEFANETLVKVAVDSTATWTRSMMVRDTDTLVVTVVSTAGDLATGIGVQWTSSNPVRLELRPLVPTSNSPQDVLAAQLGVQAIAHARGSVTVTARVDQPGVDTASFRDTVTILERWIAVSAGGGYSCGLTIDHDAFCWGATQHDVGDVLGNGSVSGSAVPTPVLGGLKFSGIATGDRHTCGVTLPTGLLYCWGENTSGQLGDGSFDPELIPGPTGGGFTFSQVSAQDGVTCGITTFFLGASADLKTNTFCWGRASAGVLGIGPPPASLAVPCFFLNAFDLDEPQRVCIPKFFGPVQAESGEDFVLRSISLGGEFACGIATLVAKAPVADQVYCWGFNFDMELGITMSPDQCELPLDPVVFFGCSLRAVPLPGGMSFRSISSGATHSCGVTSDGALYCWGKGYGAPTIVPGSSGLTFDSVSAGSTEEKSEVHSCALSEGQAYCWGDGTLGELGNGELGFAGPIHHDDLQAVLQDTLKFVAISTGGGYRFAPINVAHTCALTRDGAIYCWGFNESGPLGTPSVPYSSVPVRIAEPAP